MEFMTNNRGYIYVLANSAMPDLVKVGKTTRTPAERAAELSKVTGVPTPFIVVYEQLVEDCTAAEEFVHTMLQQKGYRESDNREFFRASPNEVIRFVMQIPNQISNNSVFTASENHEDTSEPAYPWLDLWNTAEDYFYGQNLRIENHNEALKIYKKAVKLGCLSAYIRIGDIYYKKYTYSLFSKPNEKTKAEAFDWYKKGAEQGNYYCYLKMTEFFSKRDENYYDCYKLFFTYRKKQQSDIIEKLFGESFDFDSCCFDFIENYLLNDELYKLGDKEIFDAISESKNYIISFTDEKLQSSAKELSKNEKRKKALELKIQNIGETWLVCIDGKDMNLHEIAINQLTSLNGNSTFDRYKEARIELDLREKNINLITNEMMRYEILLKWIEENLR